MYFARKERKSDPNNTIARICLIAEVKFNYWAIEC